MTNPQQYEQAYKGGVDQARIDLDRFLKEDGKNVFNPDQPIWNDKPKTTGTDVNAILDDAAPGLQWFELALVRYHRVHDVVGLAGFDRFDVPALDLGGEKVGGEPINTAGDPMKEMRRLEVKYYDQQRSMNLASLRELSTRITSAAAGNDARSGAAQITTDLSSVATAVPEYWQGQSGAAAADHLAGLHAHADQQTQYLQSVSATLTGLPDVLLQIVRDKAGFVAGFDSPQCPVAGHAMRLSGSEDPVSQIITIAAGRHDFRYDNVDAVQAQFHLQYKSSRDFWRIREVSKQWLADHFRPAVQAAFTTFVHQCALADYYIRQAYKPVMDLLDSHDQTPFPKPQDKAAAAPPGQTAATVPTSSPSGTRTRAASIDPETATPTARPIPQQSPSPVTPAATQDGPLQSLAGLAGQAGQTVQQGFSQLQNVLQQGVSELQTSAVGVDTPNLDAIPAKDLTAASASEAAGSRTLASLDLPGGKLTLTQAPSGTLTAAVTGPDGKTRQYSMGIKDGKPFFTENPQPATEPIAIGASKTTDPSSPAPGPHSSGASGASNAQVAVGATQPGVSEERAVGEVGRSLAAVPSVAAPEPASQGGGAMTGMPMSGMPMTGMPAGGAGAGKGTSETERRASGIVAPQPMWTALPGRDGVIDTLGEPELAVAGRLDMTPDPVQRPAETWLDPGGDPPAPPVTAPEPSTQPVFQADGVRIEIDMGDKR